VFSGVAFVVGLAYTAYFLGVRTQTPGLRCLVGYFSPYFDSLRRQGWFDKAVDSVAVRASAFPLAPGATGPVTSHR
jgi:hypothetical protein